jgi:ribosomal protein S27AE
MNENQDRHSVRRIVLPSGRSIEVVRFEADDRVERELHMCPECASDLVQPVCWNDAGGHRWELMLECPNCGWVEEGVYDRDDIDRLEERLDDGLADMLADLQRLTQANMADEIDRFISALRADHILPEDF